MLTSPVRALIDRLQVLLALDKRAKAVNDAELHNHVQKLMHPGRGHGDGRGDLALSCQWDGTQRVLCRSSHPTCPRLLRIFARLHRRRQRQRKAGGQPAAAAAAAVGRRSAGSGCGGDSGGGAPTSPRHGNVSGCAGTAHRRCRRGRHKSVAGTKGAPAAASTTPLRERPGRRRSAAAPRDADGQAARALVARGSAM